MSFFKLSIAICIYLTVSTYLAHAMDQEPIVPQIAFRAAGSLQEELNNDRSRTIPAFPLHLFFDLGLRLDEKIVKEAFEEHKKTFRTLNVQFKTERGAQFNTRLMQMRAAGQQDNSPVAPEDTVVVITMQVCGHPVTISMPVDNRNSINSNGLKAQLRRRIADISQQVGSFQQAHFEPIRKNIKEFRKSETGVALLKTLPRTYLAFCQYIAKDLTEDLGDSAQAAINSAETKKNDDKIASTKAEFEKNITVLRKLEPVAKNAKALTELTQGEYPDAIKTKAREVFCSIFEQYVQSQVER